MWGTLSGENGSMSAAAARRRGVHIINPIWAVLVRADPYIFLEIGVIHHGLHAYCHIITNSIVVGSTKTLPEAF